MLEENTIQPSPVRAEDIQKIIEERIFSGVLQPGARVNEKALADELQISRGPIREAMNALRHEGLIDIIPNRGGFVASLSMKEVLDCYDVRGGLAHTAGKLLPFTISLQQLSALQQMQTRMEELLATQDVGGYYRINKEFHSLLFVATDNATLITMNNVIERKLSLYLHKEMRNPGVLRLSNSDHLKLINLIAEGKSAEAAEAFENHILKGKERLHM